MMNQPAVKIDASELTLTDRLIYINRVAKVVKGGKRLSFSALVVTGDGQGHVGIGVGKANEVPEAINKANASARKNLVRVPITSGTIPHEIRIKYKAAELLMKPAGPGTGVIAGSSARAVLEAAGVKDILTKSLGSSNRTNMAKVTVMALSQLMEPKDEMARRRYAGLKPAEKPEEGKEAVPGG